MSIPTIQSIAFEVVSPAVKPTASIVFSGVGNDQCEITINDGVNEVTFELDTLASSSIYDGNVRVLIGATAAATASNLAAAISASILNGRLSVTNDDGAGTITLEHAVAGTFGNIAITESGDASGHVAITGFSGGSDATVAVSYQASDAPDVTFSRHHDGSVSWVDHEGREQRHHSDNPALANVFDTFVVRLTGSTPII